MSILLRRFGFSFLNSIVLSTSFALTCGLSSLIQAQAALPAERVKVSEGHKTQNYLKDGVFTGGDRAIRDVIVKDIRRASNSGFERIVIDLEGALNGEPAAIPRAPYYQVAVSPEEKRLVVSVWGNPRLLFDSKKVIQGFKKSAAVSQVELLPRVDSEVWTFVFALKSDRPVEVFELKDPVRIILDVKTSAPVTVTKKAVKVAPPAETGISEENEGVE